jgi:hypothetical protein
MAVPDPLVGRDFVLYGETAGQPPVEHTGVAAGAAVPRRRAR